MLQGLRDGGTDGFPDGEALARDDAGDAVVAADDGIFEAFGEGLADVVTEGGDEVNPVRTEAGREDGAGMIQRRLSPSSSAMMRMMSR